MPFPPSPFASSLDHDVMFRAPATIWDNITLRMGTADEGLKGCGEESQQEPGSLATLPQTTHLVSLVQVTVLSGLCYWQVDADPDRYNHRATAFSQ